MKTLLVTTPIRPIPTTYPPFGCLSIINYAREIGGEEIEFYNIDGMRPSYEEALEYIIAAKPNLFGISAVVSTAYAYTKKLSIDVKKALPDCIIVVGGNMGASADILLNCAAVDMVVLGEGEKVFLNIIKRAKETNRVLDFQDIPGLALLGSDGKMINSGYETQLPKEAVYDIDWGDLESSSDLEMFIFSPFDNAGNVTMPAFKHDERTHQPHRRQKKVATLVTSKGCVAKCTFCHRWDKGIRYVPPKIMANRIEELISKFNVGFLEFGDENFGTDKRWLKEFCELIKPMDLLFRVGGMRVNCVTPEYIEMMRDAGATNLTYGMETGSPRMLEVMEKKTKIEDNRNAVKWTLDAGLPQVVQLVIGMPGETPETIAETIDFCIYAQTMKPSQNPNDLSINYAQALPGTPLYEYGRYRKLIGRSIEDEEKYLLRISDKDAHDEFTNLNFTNYPDIECQIWRPLITISVNYAFVKKWGLSQYYNILLNDAQYFKNKRADTGYYANPKRLVDMSMTTDSINDVRKIYELDKTNSQTPPSLFSLIRGGKFGLAMICYPVLFYRLRHFLVFMVMAKNLKSIKPQIVLKQFIDYAFGRVLPKIGAAKRFSHISLRKIMQNEVKDAMQTPEAMIPLRKGR